MISAILSDKKLINEPSSLINIYTYPGSRVIEMSNDLNGEEMNYLKWLDLEKS